MIHTRIDRVTQGIAEEIIEAKLALARGADQEAVEEICRCLDHISAETTELEEVVLDVAAAARCLTCGRKRVFDERFLVRERALRKARNGKTVTGGIPITVLVGSIGQ